MGTPLAVSIQACQKPFQLVFPLDIKILPKGKMPITVSCGYLNLNLPIHNSRVGPNSLSGIRNLGFGLSLSWSDAQSLSTNGRISIPTLHTTNWKSRHRRGGVVRAAATDYYSTLNVSRNATLQEIKASYRKLARKVSSFLIYFPSNFNSVV